MVWLNSWFTEGIGERRLLQRSDNAGLDLDRHPERMIPRRSRRTGTLLADTARPQGSLVLYALLLCALALGTPAAAQEEPGSPGSPLLRDQPIAADSGGSAETDADAVESAQPAVAEPLELPPEPVPKRLFGIIPNYRANVTLENYVPLTPSEKFRIARKDSFDWPNFFLLTGYAIQAQVAHGGFTHNGGMPVFGEFYARAFGDAVISSYVTEAICPRCCTKTRGSSAWEKAPFGTARATSPRACS